MIVSTDHDHVAFFDPALDRLAVRDQIRIITGVEVTSSAPSPAAAWSIGHHNAWPIEREPHAHRQGPALLEFLTFRRRGHGEHDDASYVADETRAYWEARDPIKLYLDYLVGKGGLGHDAADQLAGAK